MGLYCCQFFFAHVFCEFPVELLVKSAKYAGSEGAVAAFHFTGGYFQLPFKQTVDVHQGDVFCFSAQTESSPGASCGAQKVVLYQLLHHFGRMVFGVSRFGGHLLHVEHGMAPCDHCHAVDCNGGGF